MICQYCHGEIKESEGVCHFCGNASLSSRPYLVLLLILTPFLLFDTIFLWIFGSKPDILMNGLIISIALSTLAAVIYGATFQIIHYKKLHSSSTKIVSGKIVDLSIRSGLVMRSYPIVEFEVKGKTYRYVYDHDKGGDIKKHKTVEIAYNVHNPHKCFLANDYRGLIIIAVALIAVGVVGGFGLCMWQLISGL